MFKTSIKISCFILFFTTSLLTFGCQNKKPSVEKQTEVEAPQQQKLKSVKTLFYNVPSPLEVTEIIKKMDLPYQRDLMNSVSNADNYLSQADIAINIGIYGADLSYIRIYNQFQDAARYLAIIKKFTRELGIPEEQEKITARRMEANIENQDSLLNIITDTFTKSDSYLKENQRGGVAALIIFGGWVETLYLATNIVDLKNPQKEMVNLITQQKHSVKNLIGLLNQYRDNYKINQILPDLKRLDAKFQEISQTKGTATKIKTKNGKTIIKNQVTLTASNQTLKEIKEINNKIRETITQL
ncbi:hypothetical protein [Labilibaculum antarcticum]|jgi:hypothetical protein|uniref:Uncharacterized protein n=1 Tax=Labilibaculum antarcticum TaxID=1717717 RepID=A0A1Y1CJX4_9BACT|nr:hypothetical protein [Labilibaculum antarcticum]BAX80282.1 hypothetical protein ALGA_1923 [Labilibaculum antarcticum]